MAQGSPDDPSDDLEKSRPEEGPVLSPDELDLSNSEYVEELEEGRFVVSPHKRTQDLPDGTGSSGDSAGAGEVGSDQAESPSPAQEDGARTSRTRSDTSGEPATEQAGGSPPSVEPTGMPVVDDHRRPVDRSTLDLEVVHRWLAADFERTDSRYAFDVTATFDGSVSQRRMASNDVVTIFESLLLWYAQQVDNNTPVEDIIGILMSESNVPVRYPPKTLHQIVKSSDLTPDDDIAALLRTINDEDGFRL